MGMLVTFIVFLILSEVFYRVPSVVWKIVGLGILIYFLFGDITPLLFILLGIVGFVILVKYIVDKSW